MILKYKSESSKFLPALHKHFRIKPGSVYADFIIKNVPHRRPRSAGFAASSFQVLEQDGAQ